MRCPKCGFLNDGDADSCAECGSLLDARTELAGKTEASTRTGLRPNVAGLLCYVFGWVSGLVFLLIEKNSFVRFHAIQSVAVFGGLGLINALLAALIPLGRGFAGFYAVARLVIAVLSVALWLLLMWKAYGGQKYGLPLAGTVAHRYSEEYSTLKD